MRGESRRIQGALPYTGEAPRTAGPFDWVFSKPIRWGSPQDLERGETGMSDPPAFDGERFRRAAGIVSKPDLVVPLLQRGEECRMQYRAVDVALAHGDVGPVPRCATAADLDFRTDQRRRSIDNGGTDFFSDIDDDASFTAGPVKMMVDIHGRRVTVRPRRE